LCSIIYFLKKAKFNIYSYFCSQIDNDTFLTEIKNNNFDISKENTTYMILCSYIFIYYDMIICFEDLCNTLYILFTFLLTKTTSWIVAHDQNNRLQIIIINRFVIISYIYIYYKRKIKRSMPLLPLKF